MERKSCTQMAMLTAAHYAEKHCLHSARCLRAGASRGSSEDPIRQLAVVNLGTMKMCSETSRSERLTAAMENEKKGEQRGRK